MKNLFTKKWLWITILVVAVLGVGGYFVYNTYFKPAPTTTTEPAMQTAVASLGNLVVSASGTGQLIPASEMSLGFDQAGTLSELDVEVGDLVKKGDLLARLQTNDTQDSINSSIADAQLSVVTAENAVKTLYDNADISRTTALNDIATYAQAVRDAQYQLENYTMPLVLEGLGAVEAVDKMKADLDAALEAFDPYRYYSPNNDTRKSLLVDLNLAQSNYDAAVKRLNYEYVLEVAQANLDKARRDYDKYKDGPAPDDLKEAEAELASAQSKLALALDTQSVIDLVAPMDGTVMSIDNNVGEVLSSTPFINLADLQQPKLVVYIDETDLDKVALEHEADVTFDALSNQAFTGKVVAIDPSLETVSNVQVVTIYVLLDKESLSADVNLLAGLNASVDVISGRATNAVLVPIEAVRDLGDGSSAVFVIQNGQPFLRVVQVGLTDVTSAQIISGVQAGETVTTGIVQTR
jgi:HlyD family secretion protein